MPISEQFERFFSKFIENVFSDKIWVEIERDFTFSIQYCNFSNVRNFTYVALSKTFEKKTCKFILLKSVNKFFNGQPFKVKENARYKLNLVLFL